MAKYSRNNPCAVRISVQMLGASLETPMVVSHDIVPISIRFTREEGAVGEWFLEAYDYETEDTELFPFKNIVKWGPENAV
jgi:hypothetical protein